MSTNNRTSPNTMSHIRQRVLLILCLTFLACAQLDGANEAIEEIDVDQDAENGYASDNSVKM